MKKIAFEGFRQFKDKCLNTEVPHGYNYLLGYPDNLKLQPTTKQYSNKFAAMQINEKNIQYHG